MNISQLYKLGKKDINKSAEILAKAFYDYPMYRHILGEQHSLENIKVFLKFLIKYSVLYGEAYACSSELEGIILFTDFKDYNMNFFRSLRAGVLSLIKLGQDSGKKFTEYDEFSTRIHKKSLKEQHQYLMLIGVDPEKQGQGFGSKLLTPMLRIAEQKGHPCYLETHNENNVQIYEKYGFKVISEDIVPGTDIIQFSMVKDN
ncbi:GNAT family N-acetyltransferase [Vallitalea okinawensis]|uniref:GNAT family N-acetyltransferase n=1 Tax=Vallitalea okinawensis TaxID=2078660 RepID=UPI000CFC8936|nr:GNAT family N-acetyltransferase [Vallitalea okinawensis]